MSLPLQPRPTTGLIIQAPPENHTIDPSADGIVEVVEIDQGQPSSSAAAAATATAAVTTTTAAATTATSGTPNGNGKSAVAGKLSTSAPCLPSSSLPNINNLVVASVNQNAFATFAASSTEKGSYRPSIPTKGKSRTNSRLSSSTTKKDGASSSSSPNTTSNKKTASVVDGSGESAASWAGKDPFNSIREESEKEWDCICTKKYTGGTSTVYTHIYQVEIDKSRVKGDDDLATVLADSKALAKVAAGHHMLCLLCKEDGKPLDKCLRKMTVARASNGNTHLNDKHKDALAKIEKEKRAAEQAKYKRKSNDKEVNNKSKKQQRLSIPSGSKRAPKVSTKERAAIDKLHQLEFKFINNGGHPDEVMNDPNFRAMIEFSIENANILRSFKHMGNRKFISIQCATFQEFVDKVTTKLDEIRKWYTNKTVSTSLLSI